MDPIIQDISKQTEIPVSEIPKPKSRQPFHKTPIVLMSLFILLVIGAFFAGTYYQGMTAKKEVMQIEDSPTPASPTPTIDSTTGWKTYEGKDSEGHLFTFRYPEEWIYQNSQNSKENFDPNKNYKEVTEIFFGEPLTENHIGETVPVYPASSFILSYFPNKDKTTVQALMKKIKDQDYFIEELKEISVDNIEAVELYHSGTLSGLAWDTSLFKGNTEYSFRIPFNAQPGGYQDQILKTFKFLDSSSGVDTANWKSVKSEKTGVSLKIPPGWVSVVNNDTSLLKSQDYVSSISLCKNTCDGFAQELISIAFPITIKGPHFDLGKKFENGLAGLTDNDKQIESWVSSQDSNYIKIDGKNTLRNDTVYKTSPPTDFAGEWCGCRQQHFYVDLGNGSILPITTTAYAPVEQNAAAIDEIMSTITFSK